MLDDVVIIGEKQSPSIKIEKGKMIFTPRNSSIIAGSTALDVLKKTPGIFVDGENNISIGGKNGVLVILNGKQTYMQKDELVTLLKATSSSSVSSVEVIHNPSAQYDAEGSGGIINIICFYLFYSFILFMFSLFVMLFFTILFLVCIVYFIVWIVKQFRR